MKTLASIESGNSFFASVKFFTKGSKHYEYFYKKLDLGTAHAYCGVLNAEERKTLYNNGYVPGFSLVQTSNEDPFSSAKREDYLCEAFKVLSEDFNLSGLLMTIEQLPIRNGVVCTKEEPKVRTTYASVTEDGKLLFENFD